MIAPGTVVTLTLEKPVAGGRMLARHDGLVVLVAGGIPGEAVEARIDRSAKGVAQATVVRVLSPSPDRRWADDWTCAGTGYAFIEYGRQIALKAEIVADAFARIGRMQLSEPVSVVPSPERGYRMRARLHAAGRRLGFFREGTHTLCNAGPTGLLLTDTVNAIDRLASALPGEAMDGLAWVDVAENVAADERLAHLVLRPGAACTPDDFALAGSVAGLTGLTMGWEAGARATTIAGRATVADPLRTLLGGELLSATPVLQRHGTSFFQSNRYLLPRLVAAVRSHVPDGEVVDLYAGVGLFAATLAATIAVRVVAVEGDASAAADLHANLSAFPGKARSVRAPVERYLRDRQSAGRATFIVDPPRTGLSRDVLREFVRLRPGRIVYVSCDPPTLARDARHLADAGYEMGRLQAFDLFPNTAHVECVTVLDLRAVRLGRTVTSGATR